MPPDHGLSDKQQSGVKGKKLRLTVLFVANADGTKKLPPLIIGRAHKPHAFQGKTGEQLGFNYRNNAKAWMTTSLYQEWLLNWDKELRREGRKILLLQDNFSGHVAPDTLTNIHVKNFELNLTAHVQPNDQGIIRCFKAHYRTEFICCAIDYYNAGITPSRIYDINQLEAMQLAVQSWDDVDTTTIRNCWRKAGILPNIASPPIQPSLPISSLVHTDADLAVPNDPIVQAENNVQGTLDDLQSIGALQRSNWMTIDELLNPAAESHKISYVTDEDIYKAVIDATKA